MPGRSSKPLALVKGHKTKAEREIRAKAEAASLTHEELKPSAEVRADKVALKEFRRLKNLFSKIEKADAIYSATLNRYCLLHSECVQLLSEIKGYEKSREELKASYEAGLMEIGLAKYIKLDDELMARIRGLDRVLDGKRRIMLSIEKESLMTLQSALRAIPKKPEEVDESPMAKFLASKRGGSG
jgi:hypothetical protein